MACSEAEAPRGVGLGFGHVGSGSEVGFTDEKSVKNGIFAAAAAVFGLQR